MTVRTQSCGDVLTKKKLDSHRGQCRGASFTCLDCMTHFHGSDYKAHTSCISEAQKYQGALYKEKPAKAKKFVTISESTSLVPRKAYVEDAPDADYDHTVALTDAPPPAPSPPAAAPAQPVNVFDFLVADETPNASRVSLGGSHEQMRMVDHAPPVFEASRQSAHELDASHEQHLDYENGYTSNGYSYGAAPVPTVQTPAPKQHHRHTSSRDSLYELGPASHQKSTDKKRKRQVEDLDLTQARLSSQELDEVMQDADPSAPLPVLHSGLTGGLHRLLSKHKFPPSPDYSGGDAPEPSPLSPDKRAKPLADKARAPAPPTTTTSTTSRGRPPAHALALVRARKPRRPSDESRPRKHHRSHHPHPEHRGSERAPSERPKRALKALEYPGHAHADDKAHQQQQQQQLVVYRTRAELFLSFVTKGPESESGCSVNKALKRYHRERGEAGLGLGRAEEEKELWRAVRLRRNERGEVVVMF
ncbi:hypothetical protein MMC15_004779 [Xylographa vitiligo]|nr:hypothetical protein [Xylographa vitiligo]